MGKQYLTEHAIIFLEKSSGLSWNYPYTVGGAGAQWFERKTGNRVVQSSNPADGTSLTFGNSVYPTLSVGPMLQS